MGRETNAVVSVQSSSLEARKIHSIIHLRIGLANRPRVKVPGRLVAPEEPAAAAEDGAEPDRAQLVLASHLEDVLELLGAAQCE